MTDIPDFAKVWCTELYDPSQEYQYFNDENDNMAANSNMALLVEEMRGMLHAGRRAVLPTK